MSEVPAIDSLLSRHDVDDSQYATQLVDGLLRLAAEAGASDLHFQPTSSGLQLKWRIDGVLLKIGIVPPEAASNVVVRLKVLAQLLTYQTQTPQEGRINQDLGTLDIRVSTFPTVFGEKAVARLLPTSETSLARISDLGLPADVEAALSAALVNTSGAVLIVGPAGSGKTTTAYACLREILATSKSQRSIASLEDPVEKVIDEVAQSEVVESAGFNLISGLRSLVRQDPDVIFVGEIRDPQTAEIALQAALTGQLVITTFHAPDTAAAISRLTDMGIPPYVLRSSVNCLLGQRLVRRLCGCATKATSQDEQATKLAQILAADIGELLIAKGCDQCRQTGYLGRQVVAELLDLNLPEIVFEIRSDTDAHRLRSIAGKQGMKSLQERGAELLQQGKISAEEIMRVFGITGHS